MVSRRNDNRGNRVAGGRVGDPVVIARLRTSRGTAAIKPRAESNLFELCRGEAVKTGGQSPSTLLAISFNSKIFEETNKTNKTNRN